MEISKILFHCCRSVLRVKFIAYNRSNSSQLKLSGGLHGTNSKKLFNLYLRQKLQIIHLYRGRRYYNSWMNTVGCGLMRYLLRVADSQISAIPIVFVMRSLTDNNGHYVGTNEFLQKTSQWVTSCMTVSLCARDLPRIAVVSESTWLDLIATYTWCKKRL